MTKITALVFILAFFFGQDAQAQSKSGDYPAQTEQSLKNTLIQMKIFQIHLEGSSKVLKIDFDYAQKRLKEKMEGTDKEIVKTIREVKKESKWKRYDEARLFELKTKKTGLERQDALIKKENDKRFSQIEFLKERNAVQISTVEKQLQVFEKMGALSFVIKKSN